MKTILRSIIIVLAVLISKSSFADDVNFTQGTYLEILNKAKQDNKIIMIDFITDWCKWCVETDRKVYTDPKVSAFANANQINWKIDAEKGEGIELTKKYGVKGFPTIIFTDADGVEIDRIYGYIPADKFLITMTDYNNGVNTYGSLKKLLEENPDDVSANFKMGEKILSSGLEGDPKVYFEKTISLDPGNAAGVTDDAKFNLAYLNEKYESLSELIKEYPASEKAKDGYMNLAGYYDEKGDYKKSDELINEAFLKYGRSDFDVNQTYGSLLLGRGYKVMKDEKATDAQRDEAIGILQSAIPYVSGTVNEASVYYVMSEIYLLNKDFKNAEDSINKALSIYDKKSYRDTKEKILKQQAAK